MMYKSTDELLALRFQNLDKDWLDMVNVTMGQMKQTCQGNARMCTNWNGGADAGTEWTFKVPKRPRPRKPLQQL